MMRVVGTFILALVFASGAAFGDQPEVGARGHEQRTARLAEVLRCLVCQNQSIADSSAPLARDLKQQIREQIDQGRTDAEILDYMVARYGDFVLYRPPMKWTTVLLWGGPFVALVLALAALGVRVSRATRTEPEHSLSDAELARAVGLLRTDEGRTGR